MRLLVCLLTFLLAPVAVDAADSANSTDSANWYPVAVVADGKPLKYSPLAKASKPWRVCALLPHGVDRFWWGISWGLSEQARQLNIKLGVYQAGGYAHLDVQRSQFANCLAHHADAILLSAITPTGLNREIAEAMRNKVVVIDLINGISDVKVTARAGGDTALIAEMAARYLLADSSKRPLSVAWFPGPVDADWVKEAEKGMSSVLKPGAASVISGGFDVPEPTRQMTLVRTMLSKSRPDYVLGNAVAAVAAARYVNADKAFHAKVVSYYATEQVVDLIRQGQILAAPTNSPVLQARIGLDLAVRALEGMPHPFDVRVAPEMLDAGSIGNFQTEKLYAPVDTWMVQREMPD